MNRGEKLNRMKRKKNTQNILRPKITLAVIEYVMRVGEIGIFLMEAWNNM